MKEGNIPVYKYLVRAVIYLTGMLFVYQRADGLAGIFIPVVFCRTLPNDGGVGTGIPHTTHTGEIPRETTQLTR